MTYEPGQNHSNVGGIAMVWDQVLATELVLRGGAFFRGDDCLLLFHHLKKYRHFQWEQACRKGLSSRYKLLITGDRVSVFSVTTKITQQTQSAFRILEKKKKDGVWIA